MSGKPLSVGSRKLILGLAFLAALVWAAPTLASPPGGDEPICEKAAAVWMQLAKPVAMPFPNDTPLEEVLKYVSQSTQCEALPNGIPIYIDPAALTEAEKTISSPVAMDLEGVPLSKTLGLALKQLGLGYQVGDGLLSIGLYQDTSSDQDLPGEQIRQQLQALTRQVEALKEEVAALRIELKAKRPVSGPGFR